MILFKKITDLRKWLDAQQEKEVDIGFVPTMGALHPGHISLVDSSKRENQITVSSIFINPTQFNDPKDFQQYPVTIENDIALLEEAGCDVLFLPAVSEIYPGGKPQSRQYDLGYLETVLEGRYRQGHFQGVCTVVSRLLDIVQPGNLYLGQKDYQQCMVITRLIGLMGKTGLIKINIAPTLRETSGLAMSSRNMRLPADKKERAASIYQSLRQIKDDLRPGDLGGLKKKATARLVQAGFKPDYVEIADASTLSLVDVWDGKQELVALVAAFLDDVRLIDNMIITE